jgi:hypothetical protein
MELRRLARVLRDGGGEAGAQVALEGCGGYGRAQWQPTPPSTRDEP